MRTLSDWLAQHLWPHAAWRYSETVERSVLMLARRVTLLERELDALRRERTPDGRPSVDTLSRRL